MGIIQIGELPGSQVLFPTSTPNQLGSTAPAMAPSDATAVRAGARVRGDGAPQYTAAEMAARANDQSVICKAAADAAARGMNASTVSGLATRCFALRAANFAAGIFVTQATPVDPHYRVQLTEAGDKIIAGDPKLAAARAALPVSRQRGFTWAAAVSRGQADAGYLAFLFGPWIGSAGVGAFDPEVKAGFDLGMAEQNVVQMTQPSDEGIPRAVLIGGGAVAVAGLAFLAWKFL